MTTQKTTQKTAPKTTTQKENKMTAPKTTTQKDKAMTTQNKVEWKLANSPQKTKNENLTEHEYVCKYKDCVFMLINKHSHYDRLKWVDLYIVKDFEKKHITSIFSFIYEQEVLKNQTVAFDGIKISFNAYGNAFSMPLPWKEIQNKAIAYIDLISND